jgi:hypothetical protein
MSMVKLKRRVLAFLALLPILNGCKTSASDSSLTPAQKRLEGLNLTLVVDAVPGAEMLGNEFYADGSEREFYASSTTRQQNRSIMPFPGDAAPEKVRVVWRDSAKIVGRANAPHLNTYEGRILGDYTIAVASRIPDDLVKDIRKNGGNLRLKFRLKPDGVLFGWDIERTPAEARNYSREEIRSKNLYFPPEYFHVGGDFYDTRY